MKPARIVVLLVALAAGGIAALLAGRSDRPAPVVQAPVKQLETVDVLIAASDIPLGQTVSGNELRWQNWPAASAGPPLTPPRRAAGCDERARRLDCALAVLHRRADPREPPDQGQ